MMNNYKNKGFTIIETLVAISVLMIAIAGPLTVANKGYSAAIDAKNRVVAMHLAQEGMEYLSYKKDNKSEGWADWNVVGETINPPSILNCSESSRCPINDGLAIFVPGTIDEFGMTNNEYGVPDPYKREYYVRYYDASPDTIEVVVVVSWESPVGLNEVSLSQYFTLYIR